MKTLLIASFVLFVSGISFLLLHKTKSDLVKTALIEYHSKKGQAAKIKSLEYSPCSQSLADSLKWKECFKLASKSIDLSLIYKQLDDKKSAEIADESAERYGKMIDSIRGAIVLRGVTKCNFTRCKYTASIKTDKEQFTDTITAILNDKMRVIWPN